MKFGLHVLAIADEFCLEEGVYAIQRQVPDLGVFVMIPSHHWNGKPQTDRSDEVRCVARKNGWVIDEIDMMKHFDSGPAHFVEASARNEAIRHIREAGYDRVLLMDTDELWMPGCFNDILWWIEECGTDCIYQNAVPVIGVPGCPVRGALDHGLVYISPSVRELTYVRSAWKPGEKPSQYGLTWTRITTRYMHFTMVRPTLEDVAAKCRTSTHYGEKYYDFEPWIEGVLPNIRPGARNVSFFTDPAYRTNFWPEVGTFTPEEWSAIPDSLKSLLHPPIS